jgi:integrase
MPVPPTLSDALLRAWGPDPTRREIADTHVRGLIVRGEPSGNPTFHLRKRTPAGRLRVTLGAYPAMKLKAAREKAIDALAAVQDGRNPTAERHAEQEAQFVALADQVRVSVRLREWQDAKDRDWSARHAAEVQRIVNREIVPTLGPRPLRSTSRADWTKLVLIKRETAPAMASLLYRVVSAFLNHAEAAGWIETPLLPRKGAKTLAPTVKSRARVLTDVELRAIWHATETVGARGRALVRLMILTGCRLREASGLRMDEIDLAARRWVLPASRSKNQRSYVLPLCPLALTELEITGITLHGYSSFSKLKCAIDQISGVANWRFHDLRRTCRTGLSKLGVNRETAEAAVNHARAGLVGIYDQHSYADEVIAAMEQWQAYVAALVIEAPSSGEVVQLRRA